MQYLKVVQWGREAFFRAEHLLGESLLKYSSHGVILQLGAGGRANTTLRRRYDARVAADSTCGKNSNRANRHALEAHAAQAGLIGSTQKLARWRRRRRDDVGSGQGCGTKPPFSESQSKQREQPRRAEDLRYAGEEL